MAKKYISNIHSLPSAPGHRIRVAITISGLKINEFAKVSGIPKPTIWAWESGRGQLTTKGALRIVEALNRLDVKCSIEWLLSGKGEGPQLKERRTPSNNPVNNFDFNPELSLLREVEFFLARDPNNFVIGVRDDSMLPFYDIGDYVGGRLLREDDIAKALNHNCIVKINDGVIMVRKVIKGHDKDTYTLAATNLLTKAKDQLLMDVKLTEAAVIVWHRKYFV